MKIPQGNGIISNRQTAGNMSSSATQFATSALSGGMQLADVWMDQRAEAKAQEVRNGQQREYNQLIEKYKSRQGKEALGSTAEFEKEASEINKRYSSGLGRRTESKLGDFGTRLSENYRMQIMGHERAQEKSYHAATFEDTFNTASELVRKDAKSWRLAFDHVNQGIDTGLKVGLWNEEEHEAKRTEFTNKFRGEAAKSYYAQDKHSFMKEIGQFGFGKAEIASWKDRYQKDLAAEQRELKSLYAEEARGLFSKRDDLKASARLQGTTEHFTAVADKLESYGYKDWAREIRDDQKKYDQLIGFDLEHKGKNLGEKVAAARSLALPEEVEGSADRLAVIKTIQAEVEKDVKNFQDDPYSYIAPRIHGETEEERTASALELQKAQGIPLKEGPLALPKERRDAYASAWESTTDIKERKKLVEDINANYGKYSSQVFGELKLNSSLALTPYLEGRDQEILIAAISSKPEISEDLNKLNVYKTASQKAEIYQALAEARKEFPTILGLEKNLKDIQTAAVGIGAIQMDPDAGAEFFDSKFQFERDSDKIIYAPTSVDIDEVVEMLDQKKADFQNSVSSGDPVADDTARMAIRDWTWINTETGYILADKKSGRAIPGTAVHYEETSEAFKRQRESKKMRIAKRQEVERSINNFDLSI